MGGAGIGIISHTHGKVERTNNGLHITNHTHTYILVVSAGLCRVSGNRERQHLSTVEKAFKPSVHSSSISWGNRCVALKQLDIDGSHAHNQWALSVTKREEQEEKEGKSLSTHAKPETLCLPDWQT